MQNSRSSIPTPPALVVAIAMPQWASPIGLREKQVNESIEFIIDSFLWDKLIFSSLPGFNLKKHFSK